MGDASFVVDEANVVKKTHMQNICSCLRLWYKCVKQTFKELQHEDVVLRTHYDSRQFR